MEFRLPHRGAHPTVTQQLNTLLAEASKSPLTAQLLSKDFKQHLKALEYLVELLSSDPSAVVDNVDLLLKWATIRFFDTNPSVLIKLLDFVVALFTWMEAQGEQLLESEMALFLPYLLIKVDYCSFRWGFSQLSIKEVQGGPKKVRTYPSSDFSKLLKNPLISPITTWLAVPIVPVFEGQTDNFIRK